MGISRFGFKANVDTSVKVNPQKNYIAVVLCFICCAFFAGVSCLFGWYDKDNSEYPIVASVIFGFIGTVFLSLTYRSGEFSDSSLLEVQQSPDFTSVKMDSIILTRKKELARVLTLISDIRALPVAAGLVDKEGNIISNPQAQAKAQAIVENANSNAEAILRGNIDNIVNVNLPTTKNDYFPEPKGNPFDERVLMHNSSLEEE